MFKAYAMRENWHEYNIVLLREFSNEYSAIKYAATRAARYGRTFVTDKQGRLIDTFSGTDCIVTIDFIVNNHE